MKALTLLHDGYAQNSTGPTIKAGSDWLKYADVPKPVIDASQVLIRVLTAAVNPSDLHFIKGEYGQVRRLGAVAGFEGCGVVEQGPKALIGKRVAFFVSPDGSGAWAEYAVTQATACVPLHDGISRTDGANQMVNPLTAVAMMQMVDGPVIITAANSQLGKLMLGLARDAGIPAIAVVRGATAANSIKDYGATSILMTENSDFVEKASSETLLLKPRIMLDAVGDQFSEKLFTYMPSRARWVSYGKLSTQSPCLTHMGQFIFMDKRIEGFWLSKWISNASKSELTSAIQKIQARFVSGLWKTDVAQIVSLSKAVNELASATKIKDGKVVLDISGG